MTTESITITHPMLIDSHAHLDAPYFAHRLPDVIRRAQQAGVEKVVTIGVTPSSTRNSIQIANEFPSVYAAAGYHPHWAKGVTPERLSEAENLARTPSVVGLGEIGLDYHHLRSPKPEQLYLFRAMLDIAAAVKLPVIIHDRSAHRDVLDILSDFRSRLAGGIIHCFSGDWPLAQRYLNWGFYLSIPGTVTYSDAAHLKKVAQNAPLEQLLLETDAPHLTPAPRKGRQNEPAFLRYTANAVAYLRKISLEEVAGTTSENVYRAFKISPLPQAPG
ncbi:MAG: TatD family hydrolase [Syntrophobacteraceae bacterium]